MRAHYHAPQRPAVALFMLVALGLALLAPLGLQQTARAAAFTVTNTSDSGPGSLRAAIALANDETENPGADEITFDLPGDGPHTITTSSTLTINSDLSILGPGADQLTVQRDENAAAFNVFFIESGQVTIDGLTISGGSAVYGGGIDNLGTLTVSNSIISGNFANTHGAAIGNSGTLTIDSSTITGNESGGHAGGVFNGRGDVVSDTRPTTGTLTVTNSTITNNTASGRAGGVYNGADSTMEITDSTISVNEATGGGGGIYNSIDSQATTSGSTIAGNVAHDLEGGGGFHNDRGTLTITNSTISGNTARGGRGIYSDGGTVSVTSSTISHNTSIPNTTPGPSIVFVPRSAASFTLTGTIVANTDSSADNCSGPIVSGGFNLSDDSSCFDNVEDDTVAASVELGALGDNGGPTETHAIGQSSPAFNAIPAVDCPTTIDQRGVNRPQGDRCDIGAFELLLALIVTNTNDDGPGSLRQVIADAGISPGADEITFDLPGDAPHTITLSSGDLIVDSDLTITGPGADALTVSGNSESRVFTVESGANVEISGLTISDGDDPGGAGGGILNDGTLLISDSIITGGAANTGAGIYNNSGTLDVINSSITDGFANAGGGIYNFEGTVTLSGSTISGHTMESNGGGIFNSGGTVEIIDSTISGTTTSIRGGGVYNFEGDVTVTNSTISGNTSNFGGAIYADGGTLTVTASTIANNTAPDGSGIYVNAGAVTLASTIVASNATGPDCTFSATADAIVSGGHNLTSDDSCFIAPPVETDLTGVDPELGPLTDNGGPTQTHAIDAESPAFNAGGDAPCATDTDQRDTARPQLGACDIGAYEAANVDAAPPVVTTEGPITVDATSPEGAVVTFEVSATDWNGDPLEVTCVPASGSIFEIGTHEVECSATDSLDQTTTETFTVTVLGEDTLLAALVQDVREAGMPAHLKPRLLTYLTVAELALDRGNTPAGCSALQTFVTQVDALSPRYVNSTLANQLTNDAQAIRQVLGC